MASIPSCTGLPLALLPGANAILLLSLTNSAGCEMGKSINMSLGKADKALLLHCAQTFFQANQGNPILLLDVMRASKDAILTYNSKVDFVRLMGEVATYVRSQVSSPSRRQKEMETFQECAQAIDSGMTNLGERQAMFLKDATEMYMRVWLGQYSHLNYCLGAGPFNSLSNNDIWDSVSSARLDGLSIRNEKVPGKVRQAYAFNEKLSGLCKAFRNERRDLGQELE